MTSLMINVVRAMFPSGQQYDYFVPVGDNPKVGDMIITSISMPTLSASTDPYAIEDAADVMRAASAKIATISEVFVNPRKHKATKIYLQLIAAEDVKQRLIENRSFLARMNEVANARAALRAKLEERHEQEMYEKMAQDDPEAARLLNVIRGVTAIPKE